MDKGGINIEIAERIMGWEIVDRDRSFIGRATRNTETLCPCRTLSYVLNLKDY